MRAMPLRKYAGLCWLAIACGWPYSVGFADADPVATAINAELDAAMNPEIMTIGGVRIAWGARLQELYSRREFRAAWTSEQSQRQLLRALADSYGDGLNLADYNLSLLQELSTRVAKADATATSRAQYDILLTEALLRLAYHLSFGKVDPVTFDAQWNYARTLPSMDVARAIDEAI